MPAPLLLNIQSWTKLGRCCLCTVPARVCASTSHCSLAFQQALHSLLEEFLLFCWPHYQFQKKLLFSRCRACDTLDENKVAVLLLSLPGSRTSMQCWEPVFWFPGTAAADPPGSTCMNQCVASQEPRSSLMPVHVHGLRYRLCIFSDVVVIVKHHLQNLLLTLQYSSRFPQQEIFTCKSFRPSIDHYSAKWHILLRLMAFTFPVQEGWVWGREGHFLVEKTGLFCRQTNSYVPHYWSNHGSHPPLSLFSSGNGSSCLAKSKLSKRSQWHPWIHESFVHMSELILTRETVRFRIKLPALVSYEWI